MVFVYNLVLELQLIRILKEENDSVRGKFCVERIRFVVSGNIREELFSFVGFCFCFVWASQTTRGGHQPPNNNTTKHHHHHQPTTTMSAGSAFGMMKKNSGTAKSAGSAAWGQRDKAKKGAKVAYDNRETVKEGLYWVCCCVVGGNVGCLCVGSKTKNKKQKTKNKKQKTKNKKQNPKPKPKSHYSNQLKQEQNLVMKTEKLFKKVVTWPTNIERLSTT